MLNCNFQSAAKAVVLFFVALVGVLGIYSAIGGLYADGSFSYTMF